MMISTKYKFGFLCVPKCASTSTETYLAQGARSCIFGLLKEQMRYVSWVWSLQVHGDIISGELEAPSI